MSAAPLLSSALEPVLHATYMHVMSGSMCTFLRRKTTNHTFFIEALGNLKLPTTTL